MLVSLIRTLILYIVIILGLRIMGKRQLGELQPSELVVTILISNIATLPIEDASIPLIGGIIPILSLVCFEVILSMITLKNSFLRKAVTGNPLIIIRDGKIDQAEMKRIRFSIDDLYEQLRTSNVFDINDVSFAIVETNGKLSIYQKFDARPLNAKMIGLENQDDDNAPPVILISDGNVVEDSLSYCNLNREWLDRTLSDNKYSIHQVFLMTCDRKANYQIVRKEENKKR